jgi:oligopeptide/dipeptide ABC transporter ATP-binding protein
MAVLYITHDLGLVEDTCDDVAVMYLGRIVEMAPVRTLLTRPLHPYTIRLLESVPRLGQRRERLPTVKGTVPLPVDLPRACAFAPRCDVVEPGCHEFVPALIEVEPGHHVRCFLHSPELE